MSDILKEAEAALADVEDSWRKGFGVDDELLARFTPDLIDELKAARAEIERLQDALTVAESQLGQP